MADETCDMEECLHETVESTEGPSHSHTKFRCIVLEVFAGSARLSKSCRDVGLEAVAVDQTSSRAEQFPIFQIDVTTVDGVDKLESFIDVEKDAILHAHFAPSCGTASRARGRPIPGQDPRSGPQPLRSDQFPNGLPTLSPSERERVSKANESYKFTIRLIRKLLSLGISVSVENPKNSFFWQVTEVAALLRDLQHRHFTIFHHCMHGGKRDKQTAWWSWDPRQPSSNMFASLALECDKQHSHEPWQPYKNAQGQVVFPTKEEAAYPKILCQRVACILKDVAIERGFSFSNDLEQQLQHKPQAATRQLFATQPRGHRLKPLVSEYGYYHILLATAGEDSSVEKFVHKLPKGAKVCHRVLFPGGVSFDDMIQKHGTVSHTEKWVTGEACEVLYVGVPREPGDFIADAVRKGHPRDIIANVPEEVKRVIFEILSGDFKNRFQCRAAFMRKWLKRSLELRAAEQDLHEGMPSYLQKILSGKRLLLWKEILVDLGYPDAAIVDDVIKGFSLTGWSPRTGVFQPDVRRPNLSIPQLVSMSPGLNAAVVESLSNASPSEHDQLVWDETLAEVERGWLVPSNSSGECFIAKRFPVPQKDKVRLVDDFSICGVNGAYGLREKLRVQAVDELCSYVAYMRDNVGDGAVPKLVGRTYDLKSAYKQFGVDPWHADRLRIAVKRPTGGVGIFSAVALPFGATGSVSSFLRVSSSLTFIGVMALQVLWTNFFDDYTCVCVDGEESNVAFYVESLFRMLGIWFAETGSKAMPFGNVFKSLGLLFDLGPLCDGSFSLQHTDARKEELANSIEQLLIAKQCSPKDLERLHGRLIWFSAFIFGRMINQLVKQVSLLSLKKERILVFDDDFTAVLNELKCTISSAKPVTITRNLCKTWYVFTDGAYEPGTDTPASVGGVLVSPSGSLVQCFGEEVPRLLVGLLLKFSDHPIYEVEVLPVLLALKLWMRFLSGCPTVFYLDNVAARASYIKGVGANNSATSFVKEFVQLESRLRIYSWFGRVPSHSNVADAPSRLNFSDPILQGCERVRIVLPTHLS